MNEKTKEFIEFYRQLCEEYGMFITTQWFFAANGDISTCVENITQANELDEHIEELNKS